MLRARRVVEGTISGLHRSPFHGFNVEFAEYREYSPGDDLRRLDWRVLGRTDRYYIKQYEEESNLRATIVDGRQRLDALRLRGDDEIRLRRDAWRLRWPRCWSSQQDPVGLALFDSQRAHRFCRRPRRRRNWCRSSASSKTPGPIARPSWGRCSKRLAEQVRQRGMVIIISDLLTDLRRVLRRAGPAAISRARDPGAARSSTRDELDLPFNDLSLFRDIEGTEELFAEPWGFRKAYQAAMQTFLSEVRDDLRPARHRPPAAADRRGSGDRAEPLSARPRAIRAPAVWEIADGQSEFSQSDASVGAGAGLDPADHPSVVSPQVSPRRLGADAYLKLSIQRNRQRIRLEQLLLLLLRTLAIMLLFFLVPGRYCMPRDSAAGSRAAAGPARSW